MKEVYCIIGKAPIKGFSKTRLAKDVGEESALRLYEAFLKDFFQSLKVEREDKKIYFFGTPIEDKTQKYFENLFSILDIPNFSFQFQSDLPFFHRIKEAFEIIQTIEGEETIIHLTGTDIPDFPFQATKESNLPSDKVALGPDSDGGFYYLIGSSRISSAFDRIEANEGEVTVLDSLKRALNSEGFSTFELLEWSDIDTLADLKDCVERGDKSLIPNTYKEFCSL